MALEQSYTSQPAGSPMGGASQAATTAKPDYWELTKCKRCYTDFLTSKREELDEAITALRYYHGSQYTAEQLRVLKKRKQPAMTFNRVGRKIDGVIGTLERLRMDAKAFARTPQHEQGADLASAAVRYVLDEQEWKSKSPQCGLDGAIEGIGGIEMEIVPGDQGDAEVGFEPVDTQSYFYDPRSFKPDFSDALYLGVGKWLEEDIAKDMFPDAPEGALEASGTDLVPSNDKENRWFSTQGQRNRVRVVEIWYKHNGGWCWAVFTGSAILKEGQSPFKDEKGKPTSKYIMFSGGVDQDGDRYGFVRNMKSAQDGLNAKQSKMQHILASKRIFLTRGAVTDIEQVRKEAARPDGVVLLDRPVNEGLKIDDQTFDFTGLGKLLELNIMEIENFGPNHALVGQGGVEKNSGRAIALLQQAGMAELGPFLIAYRGWKIRVYRAIWNAVQQFWKAQRWIRVTDDQQLAQYIQINGLGIDPQTGQPTIVNALGSLDVDIILDEGPDVMNAMQETNETLREVLPAVAPLLTPGKATSLTDILIETSGLPSDAKKRYRDAAEEEAKQPPQEPPEVQIQKAKAQVDMAKAEHSAKIDETKAQNDILAKRASAESDIEIARVKAAAEIQIMREKANAEIEINNQKAQAQIASAKMLAQAKAENMAESSAE